MEKGWMMERAIPRHRLSDRAEVDRHEKPCPPHGPILVQATGQRTYTASCLACGLEGPDRQDGWEAKLAFDEAFGTLPNG
jgi:hypothetical protein